MNEIFELYFMLYNIINCHFLLIVVCNAGYFKNGESCTLCTGNQFKPQAGDAGSCQNCGSTTVANAQHTACGK